MKSREHVIRAVFLLISVVLVAVTVLFIINFNVKKNAPATRVGLVLIGVADDNGWNQSHYFGVKKACERHDCVMYTKESVPEEEDGPLKRAVSELVRQGCSVIFLTSYGYGNFVDSVAKMYPNTAFYCISGECRAANSMSYFARMYQVRYLSGIVAGSATQSNLLGYVCAMPISETIRAVNAYALGARKANPEAKVIVKYTGSWDDREAEEAATRELAEAGADVLTFHEDRPYSIDLADEMGLFTTGYDYVSKEYSDRFLTAAVFDWDVLYSRVLADYLRGKANFSSDYWLGLSDGAVSLYPFSPLVSEDAKELVKEEQARIRTWRDVFSGLIYDNKGVLRCNENERISDDELFNRIDWYVEGIEIYE